MPRKQGDTKNVTKQIESLEAYSLHEPHAVGTTWAEDGEDLNRN